MESNAKDQLLDYLFKNLETFDVSKEEKKILTEYIVSVADNLSVVYNFLEKEDSAKKVVSALEAIARGKDV